jgi:phosphatidylglycerol:prolipoprotein diacylglycerol transferase
VITVPWGESIQLGAVELHLFGLFVGVAVAAGVELYRRQLAIAGVGTRAAYLLGLGAALAGLAGARAYYLAEHVPDRWTAATTFGGAGLTWYGGVVAAIALVVFVGRRLGLGAWTVLDCMAAPAALGLAIGRIGCLVAADGDYGRPTDLPWGVAWPHGLVPTTTRSMHDTFGVQLPGPDSRVWAVHPAPLYELLPLLVLAAWLVRRHRTLLARPGTAIATCLLVSGAVRLLVEEVRLNDPVLAGLTAAQLWSAALVVLGAGLLVRARDRAARGAVRA